MNDVTIAKGQLAGKGVFAGRDFKVGELVLSYGLRQLSQAEFDALPASEHKFTHSFWGRIYLFPVPGRYVNHSPKPNTRQNLKRQGDIALCPIRAGEAITTNAKDEAKNELETFLEAYQQAINTRGLKGLAGFMASQAKLVLNQNIYDNLTEARFEKMEQLGIWTRQSLDNIQWPKASTRRATLTYSFELPGGPEDRPALVGKVITDLEKIAGNWRITREERTWTMTDSSNQAKNHGPG